MISAGAQWYHIGWNGNSATLTFARFQATYLNLLLALGSQESPVSIRCDEARGKTQTAEGEGSGVAALTAGPCDQGDEWDA